jgi:hypothetical protein
LRKRREARHSITGIDRQRALVAQAAARLIADGQNDVEAAKRKAACQLGLTAKAVQPSDTEVRAALSSHLALFAPTTHGDALRQLRQTALAVMQKLEQFSPWISGPLLNDAATEHSQIELHFYGVESKLFEIYLNNEKIRFSNKSDSANTTGTPLRLSISFRDVYIHCALHPEMTAPTRSPSARDARPTRFQLGMARIRFEECTPDD